jgi:hypothetical protein
MAAAGFFHQTGIKVDSMRLVANQSVDGMGSSTICMRLVVKERDGIAHRWRIFLKKEGWTDPLKSAGPLVPLLPKRGMDC